MNMTNLQKTLQELLDKHRVHAATAEAVLAEALPILTRFIDVNTTAKLASSIRIDKQDLLDLLAFIEQMTAIVPTTPAESVRLTELKQLQYRITELLHNYKN